MRMESPLNQRLRRSPPDVVYTPIDVTSVDTYTAVNDGGTVTTANNRAQLTSTSDSTGEWVTITEIATPFGDSTALASLAADPDDKYFRGSITLSPNSSSSAANDGKIRVQDGDTLTVTFFKSDHVTVISSTSATIVLPTVNSTGDGGDSNAGNGICDDGTGSCTLRAAMEEANARSGADTIHFNIAGAGPHTIQPVTDLPTITDPVTIDGYTQSGASANTNGPGLGSNAVLKIELDGTNAGNGLQITAGSSTVKGLVINRFSADGILLQTVGGNVVEGNFIGTDVNGTADLGNKFGVTITNSPNNRIGGASAASRNVISGNDSEWAVGLFGTATGNVVYGNLIGTDINGTADLGNAGFGVLILSANNTVGGSTSGQGNVISRATVSAWASRATLLSPISSQGTILVRTLLALRTLAIPLTGCGFSLAPPTISSAGRALAAAT